MPGYAARYKYMTESTEIREATLAEIALVFLKLGTIAFGGPPAHLAMMEEEFVRRRRWITEADFLDRLATANLIPGPNSTEVAIFVGHLKRGWRGLLVAGCCFIIPAASIVLAIAWAYVRFGSLPQVEGILAAIKPAVVAIVIQALLKLGRTGVKTIPLALIALFAASLSLMRMGPVLVLVVAGFASASIWAAKTRRGRARGLGTGIGIPPAMAGLHKSFGITKASSALTAVAVAALAFPVSLTRLFLSFLKIGAVMFGSGYVLLAFLQTEFVERLHWLTEKQLLDSVAVGQFTPGPLSATATFIGYIVAGWKGAVVATVGIFLPGFVLVALSGPLLPRLRRSAVLAATLDGVVAGSLALMAVVAWQLGQASIVDWKTALIFGVSLVALLRFRVNSAWLIAAAAVVGWGMR